MQQRLTIYSRLRAFHWKCTHGLVYANKELTRFGHKDTSNCTFCKTPGQTFEHLLNECNITAKFWLDLQGQFPNIFNPGEITDKARLTAMLWNDDELFVTRNYLMLLAKHYIYNCNLHDDEPSIQAFSRNVIKNEKVERTISSKKDKLDVHFEKWEPILNGLSIGIPNLYTDHL